MQTQLDAVPLAVLPPVTAAPASRVQRSGGLSPELGAENRAPSGGGGEPQDDKSNQAIGKESSDKQRRGAKRSTSQPDRTSTRTKRKKPSQQDSGQRRTRHRAVCWRQQPCTSFNHNWWYRFQKTPLTLLLTTRRLPPPSLLSRHVWC